MEDGGLEELPQAPRSPGAHTPAQGHMSAPKPLRAWSPDLWLSPGSFCWENPIPVSSAHQNQRTRLEVKERDSSLYRQRRGWQPSGPLRGRLWALKGTSEAGLLSWAELGEVWQQCLSGVTAGPGNPAPWQEGDTAGRPDTAHPQTSLGRDLREAEDCVREETFPRAASAQRVQLLVVVRPPRAEGGFTVCLLGFQSRPS